MALTKSGSAVRPRPLCSGSLGGLGTCLVSDTDQNTSLPPPYISRPISVFILPSQARPFWPESLVLIRALRVGYCHTHAAGQRVEPVPAHVAEVPGTVFIQHGSLRSAGKDPGPCSLLSPPVCVFGGCGVGVGTTCQPFVPALKYHRHWD